MLYQGTYGGTKVDSGIHLQNSNGVATISSKVKEAESGFDKLIFYVERYGGTSSSKTNYRVYNVMESSNNRTNIVTDSTSGVTINGDNLPVLTKTVTRPDRYTIVVSDDVYNNKNIRTGGAVKIAGGYHVISEKKQEDGKNKICFTDEIETSYTSADFVYGMVVNTSGEIGRADSDGDSMKEDITKSGSDYIWTAQFDSSNIPDGPVEIHVVVFDVAGNMTHSCVQSRISNNVARITSVKLGTDLNGNNSIETNETTTFYAFKDSHGNGDTTKGVSVWNLVTSEETETYGRPWTIKKDLSIEPEFVGGTTPLYYIVSSAAVT